jgi:hypothetical protein
VSRLRAFPRHPDEFVRLWAPRSPIRPEGRTSRNTTFGCPLRPRHFSHWVSAACCSGDHGRRQAIHGRPGYAAPVTSRPSTFSGVHQPAKPRSAGRPVRSPCRSRSAISAAARNAGSGSDRLLSAARATSASPGAPRGRPSRSGRASAPRHDRTDARRRRVAARGSRAPRRAAHGEAQRRPRAGGWRSGGRDGAREKAVRGPL